MAKNNGELIDFLAPNALSDLREGNRLVLEAIGNIAKLHTKMSGAKTPKTSDTVNKELIADYDKMQRIIKELQLEYIKLAEAKVRVTKGVTKESVEQGILNTRTREGIRANSELAGAYANLSAQVSIASRKYQDIMVRGRQASQSQKQFNSELKTAQREFQALQNKVLQADKAVDKWQRTGKRSISVTKDLLGAFGVVGGTMLIASIAKDIFNTTRELQALDLALKQVIGSEKEVAETQQFLSKIADDYGIDIKVLTKSYTGFFAASKNAMDEGKISAQQIRDIFQSVSKAAGAMGLSVDQQEGAFLALSQMISKGNIQAEELRGQLSERLPGAFGILAKSMGVTEIQLNKMLQDGKVLAAEVLPGFARELEKAYGVENLKRVESINASVTRLGNSWTDFVASLSEGGGTFSRVTSLFINNISLLLGALNKLLKSSNELRKEELIDVKSKATEAYLNYYRDLGKARKADIEEERKNMIESVGMLKQQFEALKARNRELRANKTHTPLGDVIPLEARKEIAANDAQIKKLNNTMYHQNGIISAANKYLQEIAPIKKADVEITKNQTAATEKHVEVLKQIKKFTEDYYNSEISRVRVLRNSLADTTEEYQDYNNQLIILEDMLSRLQGKNPDEIIVSEEQVRVLNEGIEKMKSFEESTEDTTEATKALRDATEEFLKSIAESTLGELGFDSLTTFFDGTFEKLMEGADTLGEKFAVTFNAIGEVAKEAFEYIESAQQANFDAQFTRLEKQKEISLLFAGESATAREEIERQYEERRKAIQRQQAEAQKRSAIFSAVINIAQGITAALATANIPLAVTIGILGALQVGAISAQEIPAFKDGGVHDGGYMLVNDAPGSRYQEKVITPDGKVYSPKGRNVIINAPKGTEIKTPDQWDAFMFDKNLNGLLANNGISKPETKVTVSTDIDYDRLGNVIAKNTQSSKGSGIEIRKDHKGYGVYERRANATVKLHNARLYVRGEDV